MAGVHVERDVRGAIKALKMGTALVSTTSAQKFVGQKIQELQRSFENIPEDIRKRRAPCHEEDWNHRVTKNGDHGDRNN
ncbi:hypothetical protein CHS0354_023047 [Potamilus streckersoni]|uniref:Uncharacterized protein n=1 Tax=Potamilus streckersoni TaxID=2493646 RepID=A0AAE0RW70_9BIVA|nr:hypothetical protein CHS0354_023047 [Potamilus streckersoni]